MLGENDLEEYLCELWGIYVGPRGEKWAILVSRSTTTSIVSNPLETGNHLIKSMDMEDHGLSGIVRKRSGLLDLCLTVLSQ